MRLRDATVCESEGGSSSGGGPMVEVVGCGDGSVVGGAQRSLCPGDDRPRTTENEGPARRVAPLVTEPGGGPVMPVVTGGGPRARPGPRRHRIRLCLSGDACSCQGTAACVRLGRGTAEEEAEFQEFCNDVRPGSFKARGFEAYRGDLLRGLDGSLAYSTQLLERGQRSVGESRAVGARAVRPYLLASQCVRTLFACEDALGNDFAPGRVQALIDFWGGGGSRLGTQRGAEAEEERVAPQGPLQSAGDPPATPTADGREPTGATDSSHVQVPREGALPGKAGRAHAPAADRMAAEVAVWQAIFGDPTAKATDAAARPPRGDGGAAFRRRWHRRRRRKRKARRRILSARCQRGHPLYRPEGQSLASLAGWS